MPNIFLAEASYFIAIATPPQEPEQAEASVYVCVSIICSEKNEVSIQDIPRRMDGWNGWMPARLRQQINICECRMRLVSRASLFQQKKTADN